MKRRTPAELHVRAPQNCTFHLKQNLRWWVAAFRQLIVLVAQHLCASLALVEGYSLCELGDDYWVCAIASFLYGLVPMEDYPAR